MQDIIKSTGKQLVLIKPFALLKLFVLLKPLVFVEPLALLKPFTEKEERDGLQATWR